MEDTEAVATRVLIVDDSLAVRRLLAGRLRHAGCRVSEAKDGVDALEEFRRARVEVVVTDVSMPRLGGLALLAALRAEEPAPEVVLLSGADDADSAEAAEAFRLGAHDYVPKTKGAVEAVALAVRRAAEKWRLRAEQRSARDRAFATGALPRLAAAAGGPGGARC